jgi:signal transduction histidine kinase
MIARVSSRRVSTRRKLGALSLKAAIGGLAAGILLLPVALVFIIRLAISTSAPATPVFRFQFVSRELLAAVEYKGGAIAIKGGYEPPEDLSLIIEGADGTVLLSNVGPFRVGSTASLDEVAAFIGGDRAVKNFFTESVRSSEGAAIGTYFAWFTDRYRPTHDESASIGMLVVVGLLALAFGLGALVATYLARAVLKLERAAGRIAAGDLESEVRVRGIHEIEDLARAMDGMRAALREERDRRARFLAAVSHDLRTPLTSIGGYLEAVEDGLASSPSTLERYVRIMRDKTRLLEGRIASLIEFARMETGEWRLGFETVELGPFLEGLARGFREDAALMGRVFLFELSALDGLSAPVDRALLSRALENLVSNAIRYSPPGSVVRMTARPSGQAYVLDIDDEGPGISLPDRERVFEAFARGKGARDGEGNGLGLYIARSVIQGHGWDIRVDEAPGGGGRVSVTVPAPTDPR